MKQWIKFIIVSILAAPLFACENYDPDLYRNTPVIQDVKFTGTQKTKNTIEMTVIIKLNKNYGERIYVQVGKLSSTYFDVSFLNDNEYKQTYTLYASDFDQIDYSTGTLTFNNVIVAVKAKDDSKQTLASFTAGNLYWRVQPSIKISKVTKDRTYYKSGRYYTEYTYWYEVSGAFFFTDIYKYYIGNWSTEGKGSSLYDYGPENDDYNQSLSIDYLYSMADTLYMQLRGRTGDYTEITSNYSVRFVGTGSGDVDVSLVWSSTIPNTYARNLSESAIGGGEGTALSKIRFKQSLSQEVIEMTYDRQTK